jgi:signal transduction histidine kinase
MATLLPPVLTLPAVLLGLSFSLNILLLARQFLPTKKRRPRLLDRSPAQPPSPHDPTFPTTTETIPPETQRLAELQTRFILMVSHEYRTPLTTILTTTELLERYGNKITDQNKQRYTQRIKQSVQHLIQLLNDTLQLDRDSIPLILQPLELPPFCHSLLTDIKTLTDDRHQLIHHFDNLPPSAITTDELILRQVLTALLSNAIKFSPSTLTNPHPIVKFEVLYQPFSPGLSYADLDYSGLAHQTRPDGLLIFKITDFGIGIPDRDRAHIFDRFYRGSNISTIGGTGLGLKLAQSGIDRLGGTLQITSQEHQGTTARISLPIYHGKSQPAALPA